MDYVQKMSTVKKAILTAVCLALCVVLPQAFHAIPNAGSIYLPMHIPVLLCGLICGAPYGLLCGLAGPVLSALFTGMPPIAVLPSMIVECAVYGLVTGLLMKGIHTGKLAADLYISLVVAMLAGRIVSGLAKALIFSAGNYSFAVWAAGSFVAAIPGIVIQLILIPLIVIALTKARLIPYRYVKEEKQNGQN